MKESKIKGLYIIDLPTFDDERGFFREVFRLNELEEKIGKKVNFVRLNHSRSKQNVLRGMHVANFEKLIYVISGEVLAVFVDTRKASPTSGQYEMMTLGEDKLQAIYLPPGIANSFYVKSKSADYVYLVTQYYDPADEKTIRWDDADLNIPWPNKNPIISDRDREAPGFKEVFNEN